MSQDPMVGKRYMVPDGGGGYTEATPEQVARIEEKMQRLRDVCSGDGPPVGDHPFAGTLPKPDDNTKFPKFAALVERWRDPCLDMYDPPSFSESKEAIVSLSALLRELEDTVFRDPTSLEDLAEAVQRALAAARD